MKNPEFKQDPAQLLRKIDARWKEKLGPLYGKFFVAPGVLWPSEFTADGEWCPLPPKKPAESVRLAAEGTQLKKAIGAEFEFRAESENVALHTVDMAATSLASHNSDEFQSAKKRDFLSRTDIAEMLDRADFSCERQASTGRRNYRRRHLVAALKGIWRASSHPYGVGELLCFASVEGYAIEAGVSERALRYNLRELEKLQVLQLVLPANSERRPATYRLNLAALRRRRTYEEVKKTRPPRRALHSVHHSSPRPQEPAAAPSPAPAAAPVPVAHRSPVPAIGTRQFERIRKQRAELKERIAVLMKGCHGKIPTERGESLWVDEDSPLYRAPMSPESAFIAACMAMQLTEREGRQLLKPEDAEKSS